MALWTSVIDPAELTGYARGALADLPQHQSALRAFLPSRLVNDIEWSTFVGQGGLDKAAMYRNYDATSRVAERPAAQKMRGELPPMSEELRLGEYEILRKRADPDGPMRDALINDAITLAKRIETRLEIARGQVLETGKMTINENRVITEVDFGRDPAFTTNVTTMWNNLATSDPITDLAGAVSVYRRKNGVSPGAVLMSEKVNSLLLGNASMRAAFGTLVGTPTLLPQSKLDSLFGEYRIPPVFIYDKMIEDGSGNQVRIIDENKIILLPAPVGVEDWQSTELGATFWGPTAESTEYGDSSYDFVGNEPGILAAVHKEDRPVAVWTNASAIAMPVLANPNLSMTVTVAT